MLGWLSGFMCRFIARLNPCPPGLESLGAWVGSPYQSSRICTNEDEFIERLKELRGKGWYLSEGRRPRTKEEFFSSLTAVAFYYLSVRTHRQATAAIALGLDFEAAWRISRAEDGGPNHDPELRRRILQALGLDATKSSCA